MRRRKVIETEDVCPTCGNPTEEGFDGDWIYEYCHRIQYRRFRIEDPPLDPIVCDFYAKPPRWLQRALQLIDLGS